MLGRIEINFEPQEGFPSDIELVSEITEPIGLKPITKIYEAVATSFIVKLRAESTLTFIKQ